MNSREINLAKTLIDLYSLFLESDRPNSHATPTLEEFISYLATSVYEPVH